MVTKTKLLHIVSRNSEQISTPFSEKYFVLYYPSIQECDALRVRMATFEFCILKTEVFPVKERVGQVKEELQQLGIILTQNV